ncbi:hypothetical protein P9314_09755 [Paenibacillus validus]|uniref:Uncharacterized protein n=1 Tax=Paenibacillus validus TaxID=44253 RepID=A0A7X3CQL2_9BACL|nr:MULTISPECIES: hypothetical protein [Paenibacillus]MED4600984.1 hypothetical protein [Paenibacillus validus]MED4604969.1 hypothetical protein [Paenibacillus validus]MUG69760.1 hypothetical protein [Paenibacillus validus]
MSKMISDLKGLYSPMAAVPALYLLLLHISIWLGDPEIPKNMTTYNEMAFLPLVPMVCTLYFQRELGGTLEIYATFPVSFPRMIWRKLLLISATLLALHGGMVGSYVCRYGQIRTEIFSYAGGGSTRGEAGWLQLLLQAWPAYMSMTALSLLFILAFKKLYSGAAAGFALWLAEVLSEGRLLGHGALFTHHIPPEATFTANRWMHAAAAIAIVGFTIILANRRERWIVHDELE